MREELINNLYSDIDLLRDGQIRELVKSPGKPKCSTLANRMEKALDEILTEYEEEINGKEVTEQDQFEMLNDLLNAISKEISDLSKKQPDALLNSFKVGQINRVLVPLKDIMKNEPTIRFLDLVSEPNADERTEKSKHTYSDAAIILSQFKEACVTFRHRNYREKNNWSI